MDFLSKNFRYNRQTFQEFARDVADGKKLYLRALSADKPSDDPTRLDKDFVTISEDFVLPPQLALAKDKLFSSVLRISGPVNMWLHYDVSLYLLHLFIHKERKGSPDAKANIILQILSSSMGTYPHLNRSLISQRIGTGKYILPNPRLQTLLSLPSLRRDAPWLCARRIELQH